MPVPSTSAPEQGAQRSSSVFWLQSSVYRRLSERQGESITTRRRGTRPAGERLGARSIAHACTHARLHGRLAHDLWTTWRALDILCSGGAIRAVIAQRHLSASSDPNGYSPKGRRSDLPCGASRAPFVFDGQKDDTRLSLLSTRLSMGGESCASRSVVGITIQRSNARVRGLLCSAEAIFSLRSHPCIYALMRHSAEPPG